ncbi:hypothetical protein QBC37DRAFT_329206 [Rhypophila decipiens]|uniref:EthD domain-containing protein n=1 Tax=Rhypophila decipiens TaxID=261697 RepID=A0AAN6XV98_9PEZI|nr:hypothetical protein QBC37DRAFT_329206 [Rhypophila decipiens]
MFQITVLHYRHPSKDEESWTRWYLEEQIPRFMPIAKKHGIDRCELYLTPNRYKERFRNDMKDFKGGCASSYHLAPYDAAVTYWVTDPQKIMNMLADPDFDNKALAFENGWTDQKKIDLQIGTQTTFLEDGKIINTVVKKYPEKLGSN